MAEFSNPVRSQQVISRDTKLRRLNLKAWMKLVDVLNIRNRWKEVASRVKKPNSETELRYTVKELSKLEDQWKCSSSPAEAFLDHWSTSLKKQPTVEDLFQLLIEANLYQTADTLSKEFLNVALFPTKQSDKQTEEILDNLKNCDIEPHEETKSTICLKSDKNENGEAPSPGGLDNQSTEYHSPVNQCAPDPSGEHRELDESSQPVTQNVSMKHFNYGHLAQVTRNFCDISVYQGGYKVGEGAFGTVYRAYSGGQWIAVKKLKNALDKQYFNELDVLSRYKHENLLPLLGYSSDGPYCCLIYTYVKNGSLQERLACMGGTPPIPWAKRMSIACFTAKGINHLHTFESQPLVHRDIKSANVLLDENLVPKVGDFGLARIGNSGTSSTVAFTSNIYGTSVYMAREAFNGEVSVKLDAFSYGVVLMELLTGLPPYDASREETDLISFMEENCDTVENIVSLLDTRGGAWDENIAISLYKISKKCIETRKKDRPTIAQVLPDLEKLQVLSQK